LLERPHPQSAGTIKAAEEEGEEEGEEEEATNASNIIAGDESVGVE
jgi:hypothetical protein